MGYDYESCILEEGLKEELKCACCLNIFKLATEIIPCGHNFCYDCLNQVNQNSGLCPSKLKNIIIFFCNWDFFQIVEAVPLLIVQTLYWEILSENFDFVARELLDVLIQLMLDYEIIIVLD